MPELPEVEAARRAIEENCIGKKITYSEVDHDDRVIVNTCGDYFEGALSGTTILAAHRKGKILWLQLDELPFPCFQFGMAGAVHIKVPAAARMAAMDSQDMWPPKSPKVYLVLDDGMELYFTDRKRSAKLRILKDPPAYPPISDLGPDALLEPMSADEFVAALSTKDCAIKAMLLNQSFISGIRNWVADEVLYQARIHPLQDASSLSKEHCATLQKCIKEVTHYPVQVDAESGRFHVEWLFHFRWGKGLVIEKAVEVDADSSQYPKSWISHNLGEKPGKLIEFITAGGKTTAFVPELQKLTGDQADDNNGNQPVKSSGRVKKNLSVKRKYQESEDDEAETGAENAKQKKPAKSKAKGQIKKYEAKRRSQEISDEAMMLVLTKRRPV